MKALTPLDADSGEGAPNEGATCAEECGGTRGRACGNCCGGGGGGAGMREGGGVPKDEDAARKKPVGDVEWNSDEVLRKNEK